MRSTFRVQQPCDGRGTARPVLALHFELSPAGARERIELRAARVLRLTPLGVEESAALEPLERGEQRSGIDLEHPARDLLDAPRNPESMHRLETERLEDEHVEGALNDVGRRLVHCSSGVAPGATVQPFLLIVKI